MSNREYQAVLEAACEGDALAQTALADMLEEQGWIPELFEHSGGYKVWGWTKENVGETMFHRIQDVPLGKGVWYRGHSGMHVWTYTREGAALLFALAQDQVSTED